MNNSVYNHVDIRIDTQGPLSHQNIAQEFGLKASVLDQDLPVTASPHHAGFVRVDMPQAAAVQLETSLPHGHVRIAEDFYLK